MKTEILKNNPQRAAEIITAGGLVAVPTETVYGLAGDGLNATAVEKIYEVKGRPAIKPLSLMVPGIEALERYGAEVPPAAVQLAEKYWPGPLTIILKAKPGIPEIVRAGNATIGLRCPQHEDTLALLRRLEVPLAAPSANPSGAPSPKNAEAVMNYFDGEIDAVIDGGQCGLGIESTILDMSAVPYRVLREGALPASELREALAETVFCIGITGGTGCGKTTALRILEEMGFLIIDTDEVYHRLLAESRQLSEELRDAFPSAFTNGSLDRKALGRLVYQDADELNRLNHIAHAHVNREVKRLLADWAEHGGRYAAIDAIALFESGEDQLCCFTVGILAEDEVRMARIQKRDHITADYARSRIAAQHPNRWFEENCSLTIENNGTEAEFAACCRKLFTEEMNKWMN